MKDRAVYPACCLSLEVKHDGLRIDQRFVLRLLKIPIFSQEGLRQAYHLVEVAGFECIYLCIHIW